MDSKKLVSLGLDLDEPWYVEEVSLEQVDTELILHIDIGHHKGVKFDYEGSEYSVYDHQQRSWEHLNFFQHKCHIHCRVPRVKLPDGKVKLVEVPWAMSGSSFTLLFEYELIDLVHNMMSVSAASRKMGISPGRGFRIINRHISIALATQDIDCLLYTSPSPRDGATSRMPSSA